MKTQAIFISHATQDDELVKQLRIELENLGLTLWVDSREYTVRLIMMPETQKPDRFCKPVRFIKGG
jgi:hypothetical protein